MLREFVNFHVLRLPLTWRLRDSLGSVRSPRAPGARTRRAASTTVHRQGGWMVRRETAGTQPCPAVVPRREPERRGAVHFYVATNGGGRSGDSPRTLDALRVQRSGGLQRTTQSIMSVASPRSSTDAVHFGRMSCGRKRPSLTPTSFAISSFSRPESYNLSQVMAQIKSGSAHASD